MEENCAALGRLLRRFDALRREYGMQSRAMGEIAEQLRAARPSAPVTANA